MITIYLNVNGDKVKVIQKDVTPKSGVVYEVTGVKNVLQAKYFYATYLNAVSLGDKIDDLLLVDPDTYTRLKVALKKVKIYE